MRGIISIVLVVLIVILVLGLLLPKLLRQRENANQVHCQFNMQMLFKALAAHHEPGKALPPDELTGPLPPAVVSARGLPPEDRVSWMVEPLPYLNEEAVSQLVDRSQGWAAPANHAALEKGIPRYHCPAVVNLQQSRSTHVTHLLGIAGLGTDAARLSREHPRAGAFGYRREVTFQYIRQWKGTEQTILVMESIQDNGPWLAGGPSTARGLDPQRQPYLGIAGQFGGTHADGANVLFADGSTRMVMSSITPQILEALVTLSGQDVPP